ncbi:MAG: hypothetical protein EHM28_11770, partial [Spirochaetaceae bacterium]
RASRHFRILHIMSYNSPWTWSDLQLDGFKEELSDLDVEYEIFQMDAFRQNSPEWLSQKAEEARALIAKNQPDLVYTTDDYAQDLVVRHFINSGIPFVFSGVNKAPSEYGFDKANNITGVLEREHFVETVKLMQSIFPEMRKIAVLFDSNISYEGVASHIREDAKSMNDIEFSQWLHLSTFAEFKQVITNLQGKVDALCVIGNSQFRDSSGNNVDYSVVLRWLAENSRIPDFSFWEDRSYYGILCTVSVSAMEQGRVAGNMARKILVEGIAPSEIPISTSTKGQAIISLRRARDLQIIPRIPASVLLASKIIENYKWEE